MAKHGTRRSPAGSDAADGRQAFTAAIREHFSRAGRTFPWRETYDPYEILVSEFMLQQTQVERVMHKYGEFLSRFPDVASLAGAGLQDVLHAWQGLGYNRRAIALKRTAVAVKETHGGELPRSLELLLELPGIGKSTAGAVLAFAYGIPEAFIETNIRRVFIHFFFPDKDEVKDSEILPLVEETLDRENPRQWYYALMDYGAMLKTRVPNPNRRSAHYARQAAFEGSDRQLRGKVLGTLISRGPLKTSDLISEMGREPARMYKILNAMIKEGFLKKSGDLISIT